MYIPKFLWADELWVCDSDDLRKDSFLTIVRVIDLCCLQHLETLLLVGWHGAKNKDVINSQRFSSWNKWEAESRGLNGWSLKWKLLWSYSIFLCRFCKWWHSCKIVSQLFLDRLMCRCVNSEQVMERLLSISSDYWSTFINIDADGTRDVGTPYLSEGNTYSCG